MIGQQLGPYSIDVELGSGGMGTAFRATGPDGVVALKVIHAHLLETPGFFKRFLREVRIGQEARHENVVRTCEHAPEEHRTSMLENVRLHRAIVKAWEKHGMLERQP